MDRCERGQASVLAVMWMALAFALAYGLAEVGRAAVDAAQASSAADAVALAAAATSDDGARSVAVGNAAEIVRIERLGPQVRVRVRVGRAERSARAVRVLIRLPAALDGRSLVAETIEYTAIRDRHRWPGGQRVPRRDALDRVRRPSR